MSDHSTADSQTGRSVLIVCQHFWPETFRINEIAFSLVERGWQVDVLCGMPNYPRGRYFTGYTYFHPRRERVRGLTIYRVGEIPQWKNLGSIAVSLNYLYFPPAALLNLPRLLGKSYDLVFNYSLTPVFMSFPGILMSHLKKIPNLMYILDYWPDSLYSVIPFRNRLLRSLFGRISRWHYRNSDRILTPSRGMRKMVTETVGIPDSRIAFLPQSCEAFYEQLVRSEDLHRKYDGRFNIVFAGNIGPAQALDILIPTAQLLQAMPVPSDWRIILVGDGMSRVALQASVDASGLGDRIIFEGHKPADRMPEYHELADALFASLAQDPLFDLMIPAKIQSYMAAGKPILAVMTGEGAETIRESGAGYVSEPGNPEQLAANIVKLIGCTGAERQKMGQSGFLYYQQSYRHDIIMNRLEEEMLACIRHGKA